MRKCSTSGPELICFAGGRKVWLAEGGRSWRDGRRVGTVGGSIVVVYRGSVVVCVWISCLLFCRNVKGDAGSNVLWGDVFVGGYK